MKNTNKQNGKKTGTSKQLTKKQQQQLLERLQMDFEISGFYITREHLESMGFDTANVDDSTMEELASRLGDIMDWEGDDAIQVAEEFDIPKHA